MGGFGSLFCTHCGLTIVRNIKGLFPCVHHKRFGTIGTDQIFHITEHCRNVNSSSSYWGQVTLKWDYTLLRGLRPDMTTVWQFPET